MPESVEAVFEREALPHLRHLYATACRLTRHAADAEDLVQETWLRAFRGFGGYTPGTNIRAWLFTILHRTRADSVRKLRRSPRTVALAAEPAVPPPQDPGDRAESLEHGLRDLPEVFRAAVILRDVHEFAYQEIAEILGVPMGTVMSRIHRGRTLLRRILLRSAPVSRAASRAHDAPLGEAERQVAP